MFVKGDKIVAEDMTKATAPTISGIKVNFTSDQVTAAGTTRNAAAPAGGNGG